jgi:hypothetical protein
MTRHIAARLGICAAILAWLLAHSMRPLAAEPAATDVSAAQWAQYEAAVPKTIVELQPFRRATSMSIGPAGGDMTAMLVELNPRVNAWFLLTVRPSADGEARTYHIENPQPQTQRLMLDDAHRDGIRLMDAKSNMDCQLWTDGQPMQLEQARRSTLPDTPLCDGRLYLRNAESGTYTNLERITNVLRDHVWGGDKIVGFVRETLFKDAFIESGAIGTAPRASESTRSNLDGPNPAAVGNEFALSVVKPDHLAIDVVADAEYLQRGRWYAVRDVPGMFVSVIQPEAVDPALLNTYRAAVNTLDAVESGALDYLVAMDLSQYDLGFELGTDHPRVGWSERASEAVRNPRLPGPDGINSTTPVVVNGIVLPSLVSRTVATFAGGFKREHGAFRYGSLATENAGSHYGFIEQGVIFSKLQPGLATLFVTDDGSVQMKTWARSDNALLEHIKHARQNGVPLIEFDAATRVSAPGPLVNQWGPGNWSGSNDERLRTLRAGACLQETSKSRYLIYGYFSTATPSAMARVFQAYGCRYAMHLDMNALEHTYFAVYTRQSAQMIVEHLIEGMTAVDRKGGEQLAPRFLSFPDDRDFFYVTRKEQPQ